ncbi:TPA: hypothetical protein N0F65_004658 [Lagenidium giganteum]|uniref:Uncharacterized protein n=1 Tax=Lagenidium giganteum TaxID=4803 RepID=A0AAV2ZAQ3_9STRA|nr:TPA: hypothetical protein N0F65_004658 [Lagenidium giganteum]
MKRERPHHPSVACMNVVPTPVGMGLEIAHAQRHHDDCSVVHKRIRALPMGSAKQVQASSGFGSSNLSNSSNNNSNNGSMSLHAHAMQQAKGGATLHGTAQDGSNKVGGTPTSSSPATQLQFYGFFSTTAFDRSYMSPTEAIVLAAEMAADLYGEVSMLMQLLSDIRVQNDETKAIDELMRRIGAFCGDNSRLPMSTEEAAMHASTIKSVYSGLVRVYVFLFQRYLREFTVLDVAELLTASWQRLLAFAAEYKILEEDFIHKVFEFVHKVIDACNVATH